MLIFLISACMRHLPYFILRERERSSRNYPPMFIGPQTDVKPPHYPPKNQNSHQVNQPLQSMPNEAKNATSATGSGCGPDGEAHNIQVE